MTATMKKDAFLEACNEDGVDATRDFPPFLPFKSQVGDFVTGELLSEKDTTYVPKRGKNKGKKQETTYFIIVIKRTNISGVIVGDKYTISPTGLLLYQLTEGKPKGLSYPCMVGIKYEGRDDEERHQTRVAWPLKG